MNNGKWSKKDVRQMTIHSKENKGRERLIKSMIDSQHDEWPIDFRESYYQKLCIFCRFED